MILGYRFNQPIKLTKKIIRVSFNIMFNRAIILTKNIVHLAILSVSICPHVQIINLPKTLHTAKFLNKYYQPSNLPKTITKIYLDAHFNQLIVLPSNIKMVTISTYFHNVLDNIPDGTEQIFLKNRLKSHVNNISNCTKIHYT